MPEFAGGPDDSTRSALEKKILRKLDLHILPIVSLIYLASFLDRTNIGNARIAGLERDLNLHGTQFDTALAVFFITYILCEIPSNVALKRFRPHRWLGFLVAIWGTTTTLIGLIHTFKDLVAVRLLLGLCEGGLVPGVVLYLSSMYKRHELQSRIGIFFAAASFSGAFGGLLASAIIQMDGVGNIAGWRWIFILEGIATVILSIVTFMALPSDMESAKFLTKQEREYAIWRLKQDCELPDIDEYSQVATKKEANERCSVEFEDFKQEEEEEVFEWRELRRGIFDAHTLLIGFACIGYTTSLYSFSYFFPTIVAGLGYSGYQAQLHTVPPYAVAVFLTVVVAFLSDRTKLRDPFIIVLLPLTMMGYIIAIVATTNRVRYIGSCFIAAGTYSSTPCILTGIANNSSGQYKRAAAIAVIVGFANASGFIATFIYTPDQGPSYKKGHTIALGLVAFGWVMIVVHLLYCLYENKARRDGRRDSNIAKYKVLRDAGLTKAPIGDRHPKFMFTP